MENVTCVGEGLGASQAPGQCTFEGLPQNTDLLFRRKDCRSFALTHGKPFASRLCWNPMEKAFLGRRQAFQKPKNDFPWGINKRGNVLTVTAREHAACRLTPLRRITWTYSLVHLP